MPLVEAGRVARPLDRHASSQFGDAVLFDAERDGMTILHEYYEDDYLVVWPHDADDEDRQPEPLCDIDDATTERCRAAFAEYGWLDPA